jgi:hypothetical protein
LLYFVTRSYASVSLCVSLRRFTAVSSDGVGTQESLFVSYRLRGIVLDHAYCSYHINANSPSLVVRVYYCHTFKLIHYDRLSSQDLVRDAGLTRFSNPLSTTYTPPSLSSRGLFQFVYERVGSG